MKKNTHTKKPKKEMKKMFTTYELAYYNELDYENAKAQSYYEEIEYEVNNYIDIDEIIFEDLIRRQDGVAQTTPTKKSIEVI